MQEFLSNALAWLSTPVGQIAIGVAAFLIAKRFPAAQSLIWSLLDQFKVPRPNATTVEPSKPTTSVVEVKSDEPTCDVAGLLSQLVGVLLANKQHGVASELIGLASRLDNAPDKVSP